MSGGKLMLCFNHAPIVAAASIHITVYDTAAAFYNPHDEHHAGESHFSPSQPPSHRHTTSPAASGGSQPFSGCAAS